jgi:hypothetical protein
MLSLRVVALEPSGPRTAGGTAPAESSEPDQFVEVASSAGINFTLTSGAAEKRYIIESIGGGGVAWIDYDNDGFQDLFLVNGSTFEHWKKGDSPPSRLYHNNRDGTFTDATALSRLDQKRGWGMGVCVGDSKTTILTSLCDVLRRQCPVRTTATKFTDVTRKRRAGRGWDELLLATMTATAIDLYVANYVDVDIERLGKPGSAVTASTTNPVFCGPRGLAGDRDILFHNKGDGTFEDVTERAGIDSGAIPAWAWSWLTLTGTGCLTSTLPMTRPQCTVPQQWGQDFPDIGAAAGVAYSEEGQEQAGMGIDAGDYDNDGWLDLVKAISRMTPESLSEQS